MSADLDFPVEDHPLDSKRKDSRQLILQEAFGLIFGVTFNVKHLALDKIETLKPENLNYFIEYVFWDIQDNTMSMGDYDQFKKHIAYQIYVADDLRYPKILEGIAVLQNQCTDTSLRELFTTIQSFPRYNPGLSFKDLEENLLP